MMKGRPYRYLSTLARLIAILLVALAMSMALLIIAQRVFSPFHVVISNSMYPKIQIGDAVVIKDLEPTAIKVNDVIIFHDPENRQDMIIHRVIGIQDEGGVKFFTTKGDYNKVNDNWKISMGEVIRGVAVTLPRFGNVLDFLTTPKGYTSCIVLPAAGALILVMLLGLIEKLAEMSGRKTAQISYPPTAGP